MDLYKHNKMLIILVKGYLLPAKSGIVNALKIKNIVFL